MMCPAPIQSQSSSQFSANSIESLGSFKSDSAKFNSNIILDLPESLGHQSLDDKSESSTLNQTTITHLEEQNLSEESILSESTEEYETDDNGSVKSMLDHANANDEEEQYLSLNDIVRSSIGIQELFQDDEAKVKVTRLPTNHDSNSYDSSSCSSCSSSQAFKADSFTEKRLCVPQSSIESKELMNSRSSESSIHSHQLD
eukprot:CAMPEP_0194259604 /NCGR_PEP_ID=MMETSP0158-20130606/43990_1 /TAXON_ID=33649 /ORGANISM="Thalassionema nitzschioides, Strain L26-B" /LENGTH=199 /DNA_ID=CAMNT_0038999467 /DNA_START=399 /DNA_END=998 /DNA_ORIENTATION=+